MEFRTLIQNLFLSTVRIESSTPEGRIVGTGFVYAHERVSLPEGGVAFFLVTNKHVVEDAEDGFISSDLVDQGLQRWATAYRFRPLPTLMLGTATRTSQ